MPLIIKATVKRKVITFWCHNNFYYFDLPMKNITVVKSDDTTGIPYYKDVFFPQPRLIIIKVKLFYLIRKTKTVECWCDQNEDYNEWFIKKANLQNNKIHTYKILKIRPALPLENVDHIPHVKRVKI